MTPKRVFLKDYEIVHTFRILHNGWGSDNEGWIAKNEKGTLVLLMTSHGSLYDYGKDISELHDKLVETRESVAGIKKAIAIMTPQTNKPR